MLTKEAVIDRIEVLESGHIQVRERTDIVEDGTVLSHTFHRRVIDPGSDLSGEDGRVAAIARAAWAGKTAED